MTRMLAALFLLTLASALVTSCGPSQTSQTAGSAAMAGPIARSRPSPAGNERAARRPSRPPALVEISLAEAGLDAAAMDRSAAPCQDFYRFACGGWLDSNAIPERRVHHDRLQETDDRTAVALRGILEQARTRPGSDPDATRLGAFYASCMDEDAIERAGLSGIDALLTVARSIATRSDVAGAIAELHRHGIWAAFRLEPVPDLAGAETIKLFIDSSGLGLPDRDDYLDDGARHAEVRRFYRGHVERMFLLAGQSPKEAKKSASDVLRIERELARATRTELERRELERLYKTVDRAGLATLLRRFDWDGYFTALGRPDIQTLGVTTPAYLKRLDGMLRSVSPAAWSHYLEWQILASTADALPARFGSERSLLREQLTGQPATAPRWRRCLAATSDAMGEILGARYVKEVFPAASRQAAATVIDAIVRAFAIELDEVPFLGAETRALALAKLGQVNMLVASPETWQHRDVAVDRQAFARNVLAARASAVAAELARVGRPVDRKEWPVPAHTVNAFYNPLANQVVVPAGILQPPFFAASRSAPVNLGGLSMVVGHELGHAFYDLGARFDGQGKLHDWWRPEDEASFAARGQCLVDQYSAFEPLPGVRLNGRQTVGENMADLVGVKVAFRAHRALRSGAVPRYRAEGLDEDQLFFVATAQAWCGSTRDAELSRRVAEDTQSPPRFRVLGALAGTPAFAEAFQCQEGDPMRPATPCDVW